MLNRPPTRIELRLEDDLIDLEEAIKLRQNKVKNINNILNTNIDYISSDSKLKNEENELNFMNGQNYLQSSHDKIESLNFEYKNSNLNLLNVTPNVNRGQKSTSSQITRMNVISKFISEEGEEDLEDGMDNNMLNNSNYEKVSRNAGSGIGDLSMR